MNPEIAGRALRFKALLDSDAKKMRENKGCWSAYFVCEKTARRKTSHSNVVSPNEGKTKCGEMNCRKSERFDSTVEIGELNPYGESVEGSESSKHWLAIVKQAWFTPFAI